ncbi:DNA replication and repair protein RecF [Candidatus Dojkabacteria bacterium]|nr:DNA replication and repair protein RecF [Candidatus Dojkabacteria bacterium]
MKLQRLELINFKNLNTVLDFDEQINIVIGPNGRGKTNILEALYFLSRLNSFRSDDISEIFPWNKNNGSMQSFRIGAKLTDGQDHVLIVEVQDGMGSIKKILSVDDKKVPRSKFLYLFPVFLFLPKDLDLVNGSPKLRRSELDSFIEMIYPEYIKIKTGYNRILLNRNRVIKQINENLTDLSQLAFWDEKLTIFGSQIVRKRLSVLEEFKEYLTITADSLFPSEFKDLRINYISKLVVENSQNELEEIRSNFEGKLSNGRIKELAACKTLYGPQKDDFEIFLGRMNVQKAGSRGQQRLVTLLIKFAMFKFFEVKIGKKACFLLDDVMSELDDSNKKKLEKIISSLKTQVIFTTTSKAEFSKSFLVSSKQIVI